MFHNKDSANEFSVGNPDFELRRGPCLNLLAQPAYLPSVISSFITQNKEGAQAPLAPPLDPALVFALFKQLSQQY